MSQSSCTNQNARWTNGALVQSNCNSAQRTSRVRSESKKRFSISRRCNRARQKQMDVRPAHCAQLAVQWMLMVILSSICLIGTELAAQIESPRPTGSGPLVCPLYSSAPSAGCARRSGPEAVGGRMLVRARKVDRTFRAFQRVAECERYRPRGRGDERDRAPRRRD